MFIGRTDAKVETPVLWPLDVRVDSLEKTLMLGKIESRNRKGRQRMKWLDGLSRCEFEQTLGDSEEQGSLACCSPWGHRVGHDLLNNNNRARQTFTRAPKGRGLGPGTLTKDPVPRPKLHSLPRFGTQLLPFHTQPPWGPLRGVECICRLLITDLRAKLILSSD